MPIKKAAKKAQRSSLRKNELNIKFKKELKVALKNVTSKNLNNAYKLVDKAGKKNLIHKNKAARIKSQIAKRIKQNTVKKIVKK